MRQEGASERPDEPDNIMASRLGATGLRQGTNSEAKSSKDGNSSKGRGNHMLNLLDCQIMG